MKHRSIFKPAIAIVLAGGLFASQAMAQVSTGNLSGRAAAGEKVSVRNVESGLAREVEVKKDGTFQVRRLPVGTYEVIIHKADGSEQKIMAAARIGTTTRVN